MSPPLTLLMIAIVLGVLAALLPMPYAVEVLVIVAAVVLGIVAVFRLIGSNASG